MPDNEEISLDNILNTGTDGNREGNPSNDNEGNSNPGGQDDTSASDKGVQSTNTDDTQGGDDAASVEENKGKIKSLFVDTYSKDDLDENQTALKGAILEQFKGTGFDAEGNIIDAEGKVVGSFNDVFDYVNDDKTTKDDKGNIVDTDGNIVKTAYEVAVEDTVVNSIAAKSGFELKDEEGNPIIYSDDDEGFKTLAKDIAAKQFENYKDEFFTQKPELAEIAKHILSGGTIDNYRANVDYQTLDTTTFSKEQKLSYIEQAFLDSGLDADAAKRMTGLIDSSNGVDAEFDKAKASLEANQTARNNARDAQLAQQEAAQREAVEKHWQTVEATINKGALDKVNVPDADKEGFYAYVSAAVNERGQSQDMLDASKETIEQNLMASYLRFKGYDMSSLVKAEVNKDKVLGLRERIRKSAKVTNASINDANHSNTSNDVEVSISSLLP